INDMVRCGVYNIFFFQAEDGIRDFHVTGVQTCALPISYSKTLTMPLQFNTVKLFAGSGTQELSEKIAKSYGKPLGDKTLSKFSRSEERRVGKECRSLWSTNHY